MGITRRRLLGGAAGATVLSALPGCATNPATGRRSFTGFYSLEDDIELGEQEHPKMLTAFGGEYNDSRMQRYVTRVGEKLAANTEYQEFPYQFTLLNTPIVNAFALPGGFVYISRGLLALGSNEAEMAGVLSHELGHVNARHTAERLSSAKLAQFGVLAGAIGAQVLGLPSGMAQLGQDIAVLSIQSYSRKQEFEADMLGVRYMSRAGYDPEAMVTFLSTLREQSQLEAKAMGLPEGSVDQFNMMSTHPRTVDRVRKATEAAEVERPQQPYLGRNEYLVHIDGMLFGDDPEQGIVYGRRFMHPVLRFEFMVPEGFRVRNEPDQVIAQHRSGAAMMFEMKSARSTRDMADYIQREWAAQLRLQDLQNLTVNGLSAGTGRASVKAQSGSADLRLVAYRRDAKSVYRMMFLTPRSQRRTLQGEVEETINSFKTLSAEQAAWARPMRLRVMEAGSDDAVDRYAKDLPYGAQNDSWFRLLNDMQPGEKIRRNQTLKVVSI